MTHYIFPHHMIPFLGSDQQAYLMNEEGEIMKVGFLNERSNMYWGRLKPGASIQLPDEETELIHVMNEISQREEFISPSIHMVTDDPFSKKLEAKFEQSGFFISSTGQREFTLHSADFLIAILFKDSVMMPKKTSCTGCRFISTDVLPE
ncbi:hypothetical protein AAGG52_16420 [Bacillus licheniformis]